MSEKTGNDIECDRIRGMTMQELLLDYVVENMECLIDDYCMKQAIRDRNEELQCRGPNDPRSVPCPECGAEIGKTCTTMGRRGKPRPIVSHPARREVHARKVAPKT